MLIDVSNPNTIPEEVKKFILAHFSTLPSKKVEEIKGRKIKYVKDVMCAIEKYYNPYRNAFYNELVEILKKHELMCFHATRLYSFEKIEKEGLKTNTWNSYSDNLRCVYESIGIDEKMIDKALDAVQKEYKRKYENYERNSQLCFFANINSLEEEQYNQFCENIGGELVERSLKRGYPELYTPLKENGRGAVIRFKLPYANIASYDQDRIAYQFVVYYAGIYFWDKEMEIEFDGNTEQNVPSEDILEILPYDKEVNY